MGEVWKAKDTKFGREVAIKTLPEEFAKDEERLARFEREAKLLASLNHPNIATIHGLEEDNGTRFLVLELVEGDTLADQLKGGAIPVEESLKLALQIAEALEAAHEKGVIHRDLKPANIKVTPDGKVKVLDFGLAKAFAGDGADANLSRSPTLSMAATQKGVILGTAAYMSPEQASGGTTDKRADIWSFGVVLFEMLTGRQAFDGKTVSHVLADVLKADPDWNNLPPHLHPRIKFLLERSLEKESKDRYGDISDARVDIQRVLADPSGVIVKPVAEGAQAAPRSRLHWTATGVFLAAALLIGFVHFHESDPVGPVITFETPLPEGTTGAGGAFFSLSRDGSRLAYVVADEAGQNHLWIRRLDSVEPQRMPGTQDATFPFWSPDGASVAFFARDRVMRIDLDGSTPVDLTGAETNGRGTWSPTGDILFSLGGGGPIYRVADSGGVREAVTTPTDAERGHAWPQFLPDGDHFIFLSIREEPRFTAVVGSLETGETLPLMAVGSAVFYSDPGYLVFARQGNLMAQKFDSASLEIQGDAERIAPAPNPSPIGSLQTTVSWNGVLANRVVTLDQRQRDRLAWSDGNGELIEPIGEPGRYSWPTLSSDGQRIALERETDGGPSDMWVMDARGVLAPVTSGGGARPVWSPDDRWLYFSSAQQIYRTAAGGGAPAELFFEDENDKFIESISPDGSQALISVERPGLAGRLRDLWLLDMNERAASPLVASESRVPLGSRSTEITILNSGGMLSQFSPDGRWIAYQSNRSGRSEVDVRPFPITDDRWQVSINGGTQPRWADDGSAIYFLGIENNLMRVRVETEPGFVPGVPQPVGLQSQLRSQMEGTNIRYFDVSGDGRILFLWRSGRGVGVPITITVNWPSLLGE